LLAAAIRSASLGYDTTTYRAANASAERRGVDMPSTETLERFIARVESNAHDAAIAEFYTIDSTMQENQAPPRVGRDAHVANEQRVLARARAIQSECVRPVFVSGDRVVIRWRFRFEWRDGTITEMEELAYQGWDGERVAEERFFYDPAQRVPRARDT
jgi:hypothetical protein